MIRARYVVAATVVGASCLVGGTAIAQQAPAMKSVLAGKKFNPPVKGTAEIQLAQPVTKREKDTVVTTIKVKNVSAAPIARLTVAETWYDAKGGVVTGGRASINGLLQPGEVGTLKIETPFNAGMKSNNFNFSHANGDVKPKKVAKIDEPDAAKEPAAKNASATKKK
jgi:hypothetical protein